eukprot:gene6469-7206_t
MRSRLLLEKHPVGAEATEDALLLGPEPVVEPIIFDVTNEEMLLKAAQMTRGGSGPSGIDADDWCKILSSRDFGDAGNDLRSAIAAVTRSLCTRNVGDQSITALMASRLVPLDKIPGLRPIGVGEVLQRIMGELTDVWTEVVMVVTKPDVVNACANSQMCGQKSGSVAAIHTMKMFHLVNDKERKLLALPTQTGVLGWKIFTETAKEEYENSKQVTLRSSKQNSCIRNTNGGKSQKPNKVRRDEKVRKTKTPGRKTTITHTRDD